MVKWKIAFIGFILTLLVKTVIPSHEFLGLVFVGFLVGLMAKDGILGGVATASVAGALGTIISTIIFIIIATTGSTFLIGYFGGLVGFTISGLSSLVAVIADLIYYMIIMGVAGGIGGLISGKNKN